MQIYFLYFTKIKIKIKTKLHEYLYHNIYIIIHNIIRTQTYRSEKKSYFS